MKKYYYWNDIISMNFEDINGWVDFEPSHNKQFEVFSEKFSQNLKLQRSLETLIMLYNEIIFLERAMRFELTTFTLAR